MSQNKGLCVSWNEFNTFSKLIYPYLQETLRYPERKSKFFDEQRYVRKKDGKKGPYDGVFRDEGGILVLVEAKREGARVNDGAVKQAFNYALGESFAPLPPAFVLVSNGREHLWFQRIQTEDGEFNYTPCGEIPWRHALEQRAGGNLKSELGLKQVIRLLKRIRVYVFEDLRQTYFPEGYTLSKCRLEERRPGFEKVLNTRKSYVDSRLSEAQESYAVQAVLSSIALSLTLKVLFLKILDDLASDPLQPNIRRAIAERSAGFPGILKASPYDVLDFSDACEKWIYNWMATVGITRALVFDATHNPVGYIFDGLVESEEEDIQVKTLGNVYTPIHIVKPMVDAAERALGAWKDKHVLEPACGSGHFVREVYARMLAAYLEGGGGKERLVAAHRKVLHHLRAIDIDPFAVQTTQLGIFLGLCQTNGLWKELAPDGKFDLSHVVRTGDTLDTSFKDRLQDFQADLIIGNPPYGVDVTEDKKEFFDLQNNDSYGCFLVRGLELLKPEGRLIYIVSSTFLTLRTHRPLREKLFKFADLESVLILHRNVFPGRDVFCCLVDFRKRPEKASAWAGEYRFCDAWPIHADDKDYPEALAAWAQGKPGNIPPERFGDYSIPRELLPLRLMPPHANDVEKVRGKALSVGRSLLDRGEKIYPVFGGLSSLFLFCTDTPFSDRVREAKVDFPGIGPVEALEVRRGKRWVSVVKLWQIAEVRQGLATADDAHFLRKTPGVEPNARRRYIQDVDMRCVSHLERLTKLPEDQKRNGIPVVDRKRDRYYVPFDKGGEQDTAAGELRAFWSPVDYWIDWSKRSVKELRKRAGFKPGTPTRPRFQNSDYYFEKGIVCSVTGLYAPTYRLSFGGVFGHKANLILPFSREITPYLLLVLCSSLVRYLTKNMIGSTVDFSTDYFRHIPIAVPSNAEANEAMKVFDWSVQQVPKGEYEQILGRVDDFVAGLYGLPAEDKKELKEWFKRRYPHFGRARQNPTKPASAKARG